MRLIPRNINWEEITPWTLATQARSVIAGLPDASFYLENPFTTPSGGLYSTTDDLAAFGVSILNHTLLSPIATRKWMKPHTHTASLAGSIGAPWEIVRVVSPTTGRVTDIYTKLGDSGNYGGLVALLPDFDAGFSLLAASTSVQRSSLTNQILDWITLSMLPALESQASFEAVQNLVGTYESADPRVNSSVTVACNAPTGTTHYYHGLKLTRWISNATDVLASPFLAGYEPRLLLSSPKSTPRGLAGEAAFQVSRFPQTYSYFAPGAADLGSIGPFTGQYDTNLDFWSTDTVYYGAHGLGTFVFTVDGEGKASVLARDSLTSSVMLRILVAAAEQATVNATPLNMTGQSGAKYSTVARVAHGVHSTVGRLLHSKHHERPYTIKMFTILRAGGEKQVNGNQQQ
ncbi:uncharacterized protein BP01DRAFT_384793 [Aspergillus saccharolyticus JOP 1030-1]|uniref:Beta-lactamase-like ARB-00930-like C-terminal domain-containing protein n=1 Tax=Aspergillus saccharolyticus JOP 1030-1 TaxID=1450539 RepID=A0A318ZSQ2_9EURO|nr:hypothetical protein BP01DRAFT_384793 [Aspergillus saccharolyticus JOP 1030-1]PYH43098.1 hypothetical protein BP01DRAFT_384793 [Aspergillus saccharolyticus JOP 1030-1]